MVGVSFLGKFYNHKESNKFNQRIKQDHGNIHGTKYIEQTLLVFALLKILHHASNYVSNRCTILSKEKSTTVRITLIRQTCTS